MKPQEDVVSAGNEIHLSIETMLILSVYVYKNSIHAVLFVISLLSCRSTIWIIYCILVPRLFSLLRGILLSCGSFHTRVLTDSVLQLLVNLTAV